MLQSNNRVVLGGQFADVAGTPFPGLARLAGLPLGLATDSAPAALDLTVYPNPAHAYFTVRRPGAGAATAQLFDALGRRVGSWALALPEERISGNGRPAGVYVLRVRAAGGQVSTRRIVFE